MTGVRKRRTLVSSHTALTVTGQHIDRFGKRPSQVENRRRVGKPRPYWRAAADEAQAYSGAFADSAGLIPPIEKPGFDRARLQHDVSSRLSDLVRDLAVHYGTP
jgi:hypothetical protein